MTIAGVVITCAPIELVVVKAKGVDRVDLGCVVIVSHVEDVVETTITRDR